MKWPLIFATLLLFSFGCKKEKVKKNNHLTSIFNWLNAEDDIINLEIKGDLQHLFVARHEADQYHPANIKIARGDSLMQFDMKISRRGVTRKKICDFPPIKLKFPKASLKERGFSSLNDYKLVTHCMEGEADLVLKEYLIYKLFNQLTEKSFRVKLAKIRYIDESEAVPDDIHFGFLIEGNKELASRLDGKLLDPEKLKITSVDKEQYKKMVVFQYMIANTDWNLSKGHNIKWVQTSNSEVPTPIPYDFDYCGLVNAPYAVPHPQIPIKNVRQRYLQWRGKSKEELKPVCKNFTTNKATFIEACQEFGNLTDTSKAEMVSFLETFFVEAEEETFL